MLGAMVIAVIGVAIAVYGLSLAAVEWPMPTRQRVDRPVSWRRESC